MTVKWITLLYFLRAVTAQNSDCDFYQMVDTRNSYTISNTEYPNYYQGARQCRWVADCPAGYNCRLECDLTLPQTTNCNGDRLLISKSGDLQLVEADRYCGRGTLTVTSTQQRITVGLVTVSGTSGGRFICTLRAQSIGPDPNCNCGMRRQNRIVNGSPTGINEYPMMVGLARADEGTIRCGAVIISNQYVVTAAHCVKGESIANTAVIVGEHDVTIGDSPATRAYKVESFTIHAQFNENNYDYDIAVVKVIGTIEFSDRVGRVCLPFKFVNDNFAGKTVTILGWGTTSPGGVRSKVLLAADVQVIGQAQCQTRYSTLSARQMCTNSSTGRDACQFDSGGPVLYTDPATGRLYFSGIVSYGRLCASGYPGVNTRVTTLLTWIKDNTRGTGYCET